MAGSGGTEPIPVGQPSGEAVDVRFLDPDEPASADEFESGAHQQVASLLGTLIRSDQAGRSVGLAGRWGAGKSTVIRLLTLELQTTAQSETLVFVFDAWAHQGDPLRRSFLESLAIALEEADWIDSKTSKSTRDRVAGRTKTVEDQRATKLSCAGWGGLLGAASVPLLLLFLNAWLDADHGGGNVGPAFATILALLAVLLPLAAIGIGHLVDRRRTPPESSSDSPADPAAKKGLWLTTGGETTVVTTRIIEGADPTSLEFEETFENLLNWSLKSFPQRRLVIVFDNLDRVEADNARSILGTLQTFTARRGRTAHHRQVWTVIPYDPKGLERLWDSADSSVLLRQFSDKVFQIQLDTPPIVISDWQKYSRSRLVAAFPTVPPSTIDEIVRLLGVWEDHTHAESNHYGLANPRSLNQFVNQLVAVSAIAAPFSPPLIDSAYFTLERLAGTEIASALLDNSLPKAWARHLLSKNVEPTLAGLHFGLDPDKAAQVLLEPSLRAALVTGDVPRLELLLARPHVRDLLGRAPFDDWAEEGATELTTVVDTLDRSGEFLPLRPTITRVATYIDAWKPADARAGRGLGATLHHCFPQDVEFETSLSRLMAPEVPADLDGIRAMIVYLESAHRLRGEGRLRVQPDTISLSQVVELASAATTADWRSYISLIDAPTLIADTAGLAGEDPEGLDVLLPSLLEDAPSLELGPICQSLRANLNAGLQFETRTPLYWKLLSSMQVGGVEAADREVADLVSDGSALYRFNDGVERSQHDFAAEVAWQLLSRSSEDTIQVSPLDGRGAGPFLEYIRNGPSEPDALRRVHAAALETDGHPVFVVLGILDRWPTASGWGSIVLEELLEDGVGGLAADELVHAWPRLDGLLAHQTKVLLLSRFASEQPQDLLAAIELTAAPSLAAPLLDAAETAPVSTEVRRSLKKLVASFVADASEREWTAALRNGGEPPLSLLPQVAKQRTLKAPASQALEIVLAEVLSGTSIGASPDEIQTVVSRLAKGNRAAFGRRALAQLNAEPHNVPDLFFERFGSALIEVPEFAHDPSLISVLLTDLVRDGNSAGIAWASELLDANWSVVGTFVEMSAFREAAVGAVSDYGASSELQDLQRVLDR